MSTAPTFDENNPDQVLGVYRNMQSECKQILGKIQELNMEQEEHKLVLDTMNKLDGSRRAYRLVGGVLVEKTCGKYESVLRSIYFCANSAFRRILTFSIPSKLLFFS